MTVEKFLEYFDGVKESGNQGTEWEALCPSHLDEKQSLSIGLGDKGIVLTCHAECETEEILEAVGLKMSNLFYDSPRIIRVYRWRDKNGHVSYHLRWSEGNHAKFTWSRDRENKQPGRGDCKPGLWKRRWVIRAKTVVLCEGERDAETLIRWSKKCGAWPELVATCTPNGVGSIRPEYFELLKGKQVFVAFDNDEAGQKGTQKACRILNEMGIQPKILNVPSPHKDWSEWHQAGATSKAFKNLLDKAEPWEPNKVIEQPQHQNGVQLTQFSDIQISSAKWGWEGLIPLGAISLLTGQPGVGKTGIAIDLAAQWSVGSCPGVWLHKPQKVCLCSGEDSPSSTLLPRILAAKGDPKNIFFMTMRHEGFEQGITIPDDLHKIKPDLEKNHVRALIVDPIMAHLGRRVDPFKDASLRQALSPLSRLADELRLIVILVCHLNKRSEGDIISRIGGSVGLSGAARSILLASDDPSGEESGRVLIHAKSNLGPLSDAQRYRIGSAMVKGNNRIIPTSKIVWGEHVHLSAHDVLNPQQPKGKEPIEMKEAMEWLNQFLERGPQPAAKVFSEGRRVGLSSTTIKRAKQRLEILSRKGEFHTGWMWCLPKHLLMKEIKTGC